MLCVQRAAAAADAAAAAALFVAVLMLLLLLAADVRQRTPATRGCSCLLYTSPSPRD